MKKKRIPMAWLITTAVLVVVLIVADILLNTLLYDIVCQALGRQRPVFDGDESGSSVAYEAEYDNKDDARAGAELVNEEVTAEGTVLLKNDGALPLAKGSKISVFGRNSVDIVTAGSGSAAGSGEYTKGLDDSLKEAGFEVNPTLWDFYNSRAAGSGRPSSPTLSEGNDGGTLLATGETPQSSYTSDVKNSYASYNDAAIIVISRLGGESWDLPRAMTGQEGARNDEDHYLQLDQNETDLIQAVCEAGFKHVIVLINASTTMELGFLDDPSYYAYNDKIDACLWIGAPGDTGIMSLGKILSGEINPSGRTVDTFARDFKKDPTWANFGDNNTSKGGLYTVNSNKNSSYTYAFVDYEEGIYTGYRYYETRAQSEEEGWYEENVVFPFGYGLSYTTFTQTIVDSSRVSSISLDADGNGTVSVSVDVTNTGSVAGKDVVEVYVTAPYTDGGIEKAYVTLAGFAKTSLLEPGETERVTVDVDMYYVASYDYDDANRNGFEGYELESGDYVFRIGENSHSYYDSFTATLSTGFRYANDPVTGNTVENRFDDADDELGSVLSRSDWAGTMPVTRTESEKVLSDEHTAAVNSTATNNPNTYSVRPTMGADQEYDEDGDMVYSLRSMVGLSYDDERWEKILDIVTYDEMTTLINSGAFKTSEVASIGKAETIDADGPAGFADFIGNSMTSPIYEVSHYSCEPLMAATFNVELIEEVGEAVGNEALVGDQRSGGMPYSGWYAPAMNIHRSPFGGRAGEYYSEDPFLSGMMGAHEIQGAMSKGVTCYVKHFAVNEQETSRSGVCTWLTEQSLREIYLRPFEIAVKVGGTRAMMSSFNRIGTMWTGGDYRLLTEVLRDEWGFRGMVISDYDTSSYMDNQQEAYAGGDLGLNGPGQSWSPSKSDATGLTILRNNTKNILYATANSNLMNVSVLYYRMPIWEIVLIVLNVAVVVAMAIWGVFAFRKISKNNKKAQEG